MESRSPTRGTIFSGNIHVCRLIVKYRDYATLRCGCSVSSVKCLHSSAVDSAQLAHAADKSIRARENRRCGLLVIVKEFALM